MNEFEFSGFAEVEEPIRKSKRPAVILVLGILTLVYCTCSIFYAPLSIFAKKSQAAQYEQFRGMEGMSSLWNVDGMVKAVEDYTPGIWTDLAFVGLSIIKIIAIVLLFRMKKIGLFLYIPADIIVVAITIYTSVLSMEMAKAMSDNIFFGGGMGATWASSIGGMFWIISSLVFSFGFIFSYASQYKKME